MNAEIISIGDELTSGRLLDTNSQWLSIELESLGVRTLYHTTIADELSPMVEAFSRAANRSDIVIITGGLGPTDDDLTRPALAEAFNSPLEFREPVFEWIQDLFAKRNRPMPEKNRLQAFFPVGSEMIDNPTGTAPGICIQHKRSDGGTCRLYALPGVPSEMKIMFHGSVQAAVVSANSDHTHIAHRKINTFGLGESQVEQILGDLIQRGRTPRVGITASQADISLRIMALGKTDDECQAAMKPVVDQIYTQLDGYVYGEGESSLFDATMTKLSTWNQTLSTVEWGTSGLLGAKLSEVTLPKGLSQPYRGGLVIRDLTTAALLFPSDAGEIQQTAHQFGEISPEITALLARLTRKKLATTYALAISNFPPVDKNRRAENMYVSVCNECENVHTLAWPHSGTIGMLSILAAKRAVNLLMRWDGKQ